MWYKQLRFRNDISVTLINFFSLSSAMLHPRGIMMLLERARVTSWFHQSTPFMLMSKLDSLIYMVTASLQIDEKAYDVSLDPQPITVEQELAYLGNTSFKLKSDVIFPGHSEALIRGEQMCVFVDTTSKRPVSPPKWWSDEVKGHVDESGRPFKFISTPHPSGFDEEKMIVNPSDTDFYLHAGSTNYIKFITDAYTNWHVNKFGFEGHGDPFRSVKRMVQSFQGEAAMGDSLSVRFWPNTDNEDLFHFHLLKNGTVVHECDVEFYPLTRNYMT